MLSTMKCKCPKIILTFYTCIFKKSFAEGLLISFYEKTTKIIFFQLFLEKPST